MPSHSGEKLSLGITVLLAFSVFILVIAESTPETSDYSPILGKLYSRRENLKSTSDFKNTNRQRGLVNLGSLLEMSLPSPIVNLRSLFKIGY